MGWIIGRLRSGEKDKNPNGDENGSGELREKHDQKQGLPQLDKQKEKAKTKAKMGTKKIDRFHREGESYGEEGRRISGEGERSYYPLRLENHEGERGFEGSHPPRWQRGWEKEKRRGEREW